MKNIRCEKNKVQKNVGSKKIVGWKFFWQEKIYCVQKIWGPKVILGQKKKLGPKCWVQKIYAKKILSPKKFWVPKNFGSKKILGPKKFWDQNNFGSQKFEKNYGLKGSGRIQEGQRGSGRVQQGHDVLGGSIIFLDPKLFLAQNIFDQYLYGPKIFWDPNVFLVPKLFLAQHLYGTKTIWTWFFFTHNFLWFGHEPSWTRYLGL